ncbi:M48 family metallopeptidase [Desulfovibrio desulfuricans]|uniref:M48 family metallopeptidase n=1 Tax=Desulfovibrio desulfuricans TaxID=876 RepID=UPI001C039616|nr:M48 family metallopeptidase [Desulfovibrio desulfuricans]MBT9749806.1 DUF45 domain-containing protein [Desulfovibrio desulfuricans]
MPARKVPAAPLHDLPATVEFTLADGTRLAAAVRLSTRSRRAKLSLTPRGGLVLTIPLTMGPAQLQSSLPLFLPWLERARTTLLRRVPAPQLPPSITLPLTGEFFAVVPGGDMAAGRKAATAQTGKTATVQVANGARRLLLVESSDQVRLYGAVDDISLCAQALRQWCRKKAARLLPPYLEQLATTEGFALTGVSVRDQSGRWGSCSRLRRGRPPQPVAQRSKLPQGAFGRPRSLEQLTTRIRNFFSTPPLPAAYDAAPSFAQSGSALAPAHPEGRISLNWRALLLPAPLLEHLCWHELCHLRHMDHSPAYREELARFSPQWPAREKALNAAWRSLPWWALPGEDASPSR